MTNHKDEAGNAEVAADARQRAWRTLWQGIATDALIALMMGAQVLISSDIEWNGRNWGALGLLLAKSVVQAFVASLSRRLLPPAPL